MYYKVADQWQLIAAHIAAKKPQITLRVVSGRPDTN
jgi:hypothetical protein